MNIFKIRQYSTGPPARSINMVSLLQNSIQAVKAKQETLLKDSQGEKPKPEPLKKKPAKDTSITAALNKKYKSKFRTIPSPGELSSISGFFHTTQVKLEWTTAKFLDIPGEAKRALEEKRLNELSEKKRKLLRLEKGEDEELNILAAKSQAHDLLPEIVFLGKCNVGKSTLLNSLLSHSNAKETFSFAFASRRAGFTQTMNCFNVGKRFRLIDTPGYGVKGKPEQGEQVMEYLHRRKQLRRVYLLVGASEGFSNDDFEIINHLSEEGTPFEIVFTKVDKLKSIGTVEKHIRESGVLDLPTEPFLIFTNSETNKKLHRREGFDELRASIFEVCDLKPGTKPLKIIKKTT